MYQLVFQPNTRSSLCVNFDGRVLTVGRHEDNDIVIEDPAVSAHHAKFCLEEDGLVVLDAGSSNGTWLNGRQVCRERLAHGDVRSIARLVEVLVLEDDESEGFVRPDTALLRELAKSVRSLFVRKDAGVS
ncbi:MAG: hypothetical protein CJBNEKGG_01533 [Prosthecobacter sp.]|nr:hypothetical protein [Prosthecobacter sp.]